MIKFPSKGLSKSDLFSHMKELKNSDARWEQGRSWSLVYYAGEEITEIAKEAYMLYFHENGLNPMAFPSLKRFETEVLSIASDLFHGGENVVGSLTSGGSESILMAVKTYRDQARQLRPDVKNPEVILPVSAHPAFEKAMHYFGLKPVHIPLTENYHADAEAARKAITDNTILIVGSAPAYPHGVIDPIRDLAQIALENNINLHVDACLGGFILPFAKELGYTVPEFDFRLPGVTSISADLHKYGFTAKGVSAVLYRNQEIRKFQYFAYSDWPGGLFVSPTALGTRPGGAIASAWAVLNYLGREGYLKLAKGILDTTKKLIEEINSIPELYILGQPEASIFAFGSDILNIHALADKLEHLGWSMDQQQFPSCLHFMVTPAHEKIADHFISDLKASVREVRENPEKFENGSAAMYGMIGTLPDRVQAKEYLINTLNELMKTE